MSLEPATTPPPAPSQANLAEAYLSLCKQHLARGTFAEVGLPARDPRRLVYLASSRLLRHFGLEIVRRIDTLAREEGRVYSSEAETMIGLTRLDNLQDCVATVVRENIPGDLVETGVWRGGASIFMRALLQAYGETTRIVWVVDSFAGLPKPDPVRYPADRGDRLWKVASLAVSLDNVQANFARYGLLDDQVRFVKGWFSETLPSAPIQRIAVLRLDGDMYESTTDVLDALYSKVSIGGYVIVDDYGAIDACRHAVSDFRAKKNIQEKIQAIDWTGVYWRREE